MEQNKRHFETLPSGATSWDIDYLDEMHHIVDKSKATSFVIHEYDDRGELLQEHIGLFIRSHPSS